MATKKQIERALQAALFRWETFPVSVHGWLPDRVSRADKRALRALVVADACGNQELALTAVEEIVRAPLTARNFAERYVQWWYWSDKGQPKRFTEPTSRQAAQIRHLIALGLRGAA